MTGRSLSSSRSTTENTAAHAMGSDLSMDCWTQLCLQDRGQSRLRARMLRASQKEVSVLLCARKPELQNINYQRSVGR
jgi:hypothetical protein